MDQEKRAANEVVSPQMLEELVFATIKAGRCSTLQDLLATIPLGVDRETGASKSRRIDRALQSLRRAGRIRYCRPDWLVA